MNPRAGATAAVAGTCCRNEVAAATYFLIEVAAPTTTLIAPTGPAQRGRGLQACPHRQLRVNYDIPT